MFYFSMCTYTKTYYADGCGHGDGALFSIAFKSDSFQICPCDFEKLQQPANLRVPAVQHPTGPNPAQLQTDLPR